MSLVVVENIQSLTVPVKMGDKVNRLEKQMLAMPQVECPVVHRFGPGVYIREVTIPAGTIAVGHHQNFEQMNIFLKGRVSILNSDGKVVELQAPMIYVGPPGRKMGYVHEDMVWLNVYATDEKDVEKLESTYLTKSIGWKEVVAIKEVTNLLQSQVDKDDFANFLIECGFTAEHVRKQSENQDDMTDLPFGEYKIKVAKSHIEGQGLFATADIDSGEHIAPARIGGKRTIVGRFTNHSVAPNATMIAGRGSDILLIAIRKITGCHGGRDGEEITVDYRQSLTLVREVAKGELKCLE